MGRRSSSGDSKTLLRLKGREPASQRRQWLAELPKRQTRSSGRVVFARWPAGRRPSGALENCESFAEDAVASYSWNPFMHFPLGKLHHNVSSWLPKVKLSELFAHSRELTLHGY